MEPGSADNLVARLKRGRVYRREELAAFSRAVDRDLKTLVEKQVLRKVGAGLYHYPKQSPYGELPADERELARAFLKSDDFLLVSPNMYNELGVGLTQAYHTLTVYNRKRHATVVLDGRRFEFKRPKDFPRKLTQEYLMVDLLDNLSRLPEETSRVADRLKERLADVDREAVLTAARSYGKVATRKFFEGLSSHG